MSPSGGGPGTNQYRVKGTATSRRRPSFAPQKALLASVASAPAATGAPTLAQTLEELLRASNYKLTQGSQLKKWLNERTTGDADVAALVGHPLVDETLAGKILIERMSNEAYIRALDRFGSGLKPAVAKRFSEYPEASAEPLVATFDAVRVKQRAASGPPPMVLMETLINILRHPNCPHSLKLRAAQQTNSRHLARVLVESGEPAVLAALQHTRAGKLDAIAHSKPDEIIQFVKDHPKQISALLRYDLPREVYVHIACVESADSSREYNSSTQRGTAIKRLWTEGESEIPADVMAVLQHLVEHANPRMRIDAAMYLPPLAADKLVNDPDEHVRAVAILRTADVQAVMGSLRDPSQEVRLAVADRLRRNVEACNVLALDPSPGVVAKAIDNPGLRPDIIQQAVELHRGSNAVFEAAAANPASSAQTLDWLARHAPSAHTLLAVVTNAKTQTQTLLWISQHVGSHLRDAILAAIVAHPNTPPAAKFALSI